MHFKPAIATVTAGMILILGACATRDRDVHSEPQKDNASWQERSFAVVGDIKTLCLETLGYDYPAGEIKYWINGQDSIWILAAKGKHGLITSRITVEKGVIKDLGIIESMEVRFKKSAAGSFLKQLKGLFLMRDDRLSRRVDAITGATVSSQALEATALLALRLDATLRIDLP